MIKFCCEYFDKKSKLVIYILLTIILCIFSILSPLIIGSIIDILTIQKGYNALIKHCIFFLSVQICNSIAQYLSYKLYIMLQTTAAYKLNKTLIKHLHMVNPKNIFDYNPSYLNERINTDSNTIVIFTLNLISKTISSALTLIISLVILFQLNNAFFFIALILCILYIAIYIIFKDKIFQMSLLFKENQSQFFSVLLEQLQNILFIKRHSLSSFFTNRLDKYFEKFFFNVLKTQKFSYIVSSIENILSYVAQFFVFVIAGMSVLHGDLSIGLFTISFTYYEYLLASISYFSNLSKSYQDSFSSYQRILEILSLPESIDGNQTLNNIEEIMCKAISFSYGSSHVINNFSYTFKKGNIYGIIGENGAGKSTLIDIITGIYQGDYTGEIKYNGKNIKNLNMEYVRANNISIMEQIPFFFKSTIEENIFLNNNYNSQNLSDFLKNANIKDFNDFICLNRAHKDCTCLSGGEKQKTAYLRMLAKSSDVLILDEPTSSLDFDSKRTLINYVKYISSSKIIIVVTHDPDFIAQCTNLIKL